MANDSSSPCICPFYQPEMVCCSGKYGKTIYFYMFAYEPNGPSDQSFLSMKGLGVLSAPHP